MKIIATVSDSTLMVHTGCETEKESFVLEIPDDKIPEGLKIILSSRKQNREQCSGDYLTLSFSLLVE